MDYNLLIKEESQKAITSTIVALVDYVSTNTFLNANKPKGNQGLECTFNYKKGHTTERRFLRNCDFCKKKRHAKANCFKYKNYLKVNANVVKTNVTSSKTGNINVVLSQNSTNNVSMNNALQNGITFTSEQFERYLQTMGHADSTVSSAGAPANDLHANTVGISFSSSFHNLNDY